MIKICKIVLDKIPLCGTALLDVNLTPYLSRDKTVFSNEACFVAQNSQGEEISACFIPNEKFDFFDCCSGVFVFFGLKSSREELTIYLREGVAEDSGKTADFSIHGGTVEFGGGVLPDKIVFDDGQPLEFSFLDMLKINAADGIGGYNPEAAGEFPLKLSHKGGRKILCSNHKLAVVRCFGEYENTAERRGGKGIEAIYDLYMFREYPLIYISAEIDTQYASFNTLHFMQLELSIKGFKKWFGSSPREEGNIEIPASGELLVQNWLAIEHEDFTLAYLSSGLTGLRLEGERAMLHGYDDLANRNAWLKNNPSEKLSGWLYASSEKNGYEGVERTYLQLPDRASVSAMSLAAPEEKYAVHMESGEIKVTVNLNETGISLGEVKDKKTGTVLVDFAPNSLFSIHMLNINTDEIVHLPSDTGWDCVTVSDAGDKYTFTLAGNSICGEIQAVLTGEAFKGVGKLQWSFSMENNSSEWSLWEVSFAELPLRECWENQTIVYPKGPGALLENAWQGKPKLRYVYPSISYGMQFFASYGSCSSNGSTGCRGIYWGVHDIGGGRKDMYTNYYDRGKTIHLGFVQPVANMGERGNRFEDDTKVVWQLFDGDWFDAASIYREWVQADSNWCRRLHSPYREDTPEWFKNTAVWLYSNVLAERPVWVQNGDPKENKEESVDWKDRIKKLASRIGLPVSVHAYRWHQIPFDNDYPHYFPCREGFPEDVRELQALGVKVMPYINARLWDTRDRETEDWLFSGMALPGTAKSRSQKPWKEFYSSREKDGSDVVLGVMCPSSERWKRKMKEIVGKLFDEVGVDAVYMDQVAAAPPMPCFDTSHPHKPGAGGWWADCYNELVGEIRSEMPAYGALATECSSEPYMNMFDGYLTWHWEYPDSIPLFPAVYAGKVQTFGRNYKYIEDRLCTCMLAAQQLVYGEQIGWFEPEIVEKPYFEVIASYIKLRWNIRDFFNRGKLCRPLKLSGSPGILVNWGWSAKKVCLPALQSSVWKSEDGKSLLILLANGSDNGVNTPVCFSARDYGLCSEFLKAEIITSEGIEEEFRSPNDFCREYNVKKESAFALKLTILSEH